VDKFDAFISYSHAVDGKLAPAIQDGLQRLAKKLLQRRALRVFRDQTGLATNPHLWVSIQGAMDASEWFVLLASPESAASSWVNREVATWLERKPAERLLIVVTGGTLTFHRDGGVDVERTNCLPPAAVAALDHEPRWLDLRWARGDTQLDLRNGRFRAAIADLAAPIHGVAKDDLEGEDVRQQKRVRRLAAAGLAAVTVLAIASTTAALVAVDQRRKAAAQRDDAELQRDQAESERMRADDEARRATAKGLAARAAALAPSSIGLSLLLAIEGYRLEPSIDTETGLLTTLESGRLITSMSTGLPDDVYDLEASPDRSALYVLTRGGEILEYDAESLAQVGEPLATGIEGVWSLDVSGDGSRLAYASAGGVGVIDLVSRTVVADGLGGSTAEGVALTSDGSRVAVSLTVDEVVRVFDVDTAEQLYEIPGLGPPAFLPDGRLAIEEWATTGLSLYELRGSAATIESTVELPVRGAGFLELSGDGSTFLAGGEQGDVVLVDAATLEQRGPVIRSRDSRINDFFFSPDDSLAGFSSGDGSVTVIDVEDGREVATLTGLTGALVTEFTDDSTLVSASSTAIDSAAWTIGPIPAVGSSHSMDGPVISPLAIDNGTRLVFDVGDTVLVSPVEALSSPDLQRSFADDAPVDVFTLPLSVSESAGLAAIFVVGFEGDEFAFRRLHVVELADLHDRAVFEFDSPVVNAAFSPDGQLVAVGFADGRLAVLDVDSGERLVGPIDVDEFPWSLSMLAWSPDGSRLHTGGQDGTLRTFDTASWEVLAERPLTPQFGLTSAHMSEDGTTFVVPSEGGSVFVVDSMTGEPIGEPFTAAGTQFRSAVIARDGTTLATQSVDGHLRLWDIATRQPIGPPLAGHNYSQSLELVTDDVVVSGGPEPSIITWTLDPASWVTRACEVTGRNLTLDEWERHVGGPYRRTCEQWPAGA
jgi:WD40 repeat protein